MAHSGARADVPTNLSLHSRKWRVGALVRRASGSGRKCSSWARPRSASKRPSREGQRKPAGECLPVKSSSWARPRSASKRPSREGQRKPAGECLPVKLPLLGSNQDSSDPESDVLPVTPRGTGYISHPPWQTLQVRPPRHPFQDRNVPQRRSWLARTRLASDSPSRS